MSGHDVWVTAYYLPPEIFNTVPIFFLTTDLPENDYLAKTISHKLCDANPETRIASAIMLGEGGAKLLEAMNWEPEVYHLNESHALPLVFYLYNKYKNTDDIKKRLVFTNHTPEQSGNQKTSLSLLDKSGFFCGVPLAEVRAITQTNGDELDHTLSVLHLSKKANAVSQLHQKTLFEMWTRQKGICDIISITNAQNYTYWHYEDMYRALAANDDGALIRKKIQGKQNLFEVVADQCGEIYDEKICTIIFAKRFAGYKRPDLLFHDMKRFHRLVTNKERPVQIIWAGKPYPVDYVEIGVFDQITNVCKTYSNCSVLVGYELKLSKILKQGANVWLNLPRMTHEASGTSGMTAAMNGTVTVSLADGWFPEFARDKINSFVIPSADISLSENIKDDTDAASLYQLLETEVLPLYYDNPGGWLEIIKNGMRNIIPQFDSNRMVKEYYEKLYQID